MVDDCQAPCAATAAGHGAVTLQARLFQCLARADGACSGCFQGLLRCLVCIGPLQGDGEAGAAICGAGDDCLAATAHLPPRWVGKTESEFVVVVAVVFALDSRAPEQAVRALLKFTG